MRLYIAGPMTGLPNNNYPEFRRVEGELRPRYTVLNPARIDEWTYDSLSDAQRTWEWYMRRALEMVVKADGIATLPGWAHSRGASLEVHVAHRLGMPVRPWWEW